MQRNPALRPTLRFGLILAVASLSSLPGTLRADPYGTPGPFLPPGPGVHAPPPGPERYPGKEYTDSPDRDGHTGVPVHSQVVFWDGLGGVMNGPTRIPDPVHGIPNGHDIDAQANGGDALFREVRDDRAWLILSTEGDAMSDGTQAPLLWEAPGPEPAPAPPGTPLVGIWARPDQVNKNSGVMDLNSVEIWGPEKVSDTTHFSYQSDPGGFPIWVVNGIGNTDPWQPAGWASPMTGADIAKAIGYPAMASGIDLDGLMVNEAETQIIFSIEHLSLPGVATFDGGELWVWDYSNLALGAAGWLFHGGHNWDTAFDVAATFHTVTDEVDAIEAIGIPEPGTMIAGGVLGLLSLAALRRRLTRA